MNKFIILLLLITINCFSQELTLNQSTDFYEFSKIVEINDVKLSEKFSKRFKDINLTNLENVDNSISGYGFSNHLVGGFATVEIKYKVKIEFKENKYKLTLTNFILTDKNGSNPIEGMGSFKKRWIKTINKKLPSIVDNIEKINSEIEKW
jgi:hypothetical protein